jgi:hypothetical protein
MSTHIPNTYSSSSGYYASGTPTDPHARPGPTGDDGDIFDHHPHTGNLLLSGKYTFQASAGDSVRTVRDPLGQRSQVTMVDFQHGHYTTHSTSPRAELKLDGNLKEGGSYSYNFGFMREKHTSTTFFQILDHNGSKPSPRMWLSVKNDQYVLHLREDAGTGSRVVDYNLGHAEPGKWDDIKIDYKRGIGNGSVSISINGKNVFEKSNISTMYNTHADAYAKIGQYRNQGDTNPGRVYFSGVNTSGVMNPNTSTSNKELPPNAGGSHFGNSYLVNPNSSGGFDPNGIADPSSSSGSRTFHTDDGTSGFFNSLFSGASGYFESLMQIIMQYDPGLFSFMPNLFSKIGTPTGTGDPTGSNGPGLNPSEGGNPAPNFKTFVATPGSNGGSYDDMIRSASQKYGVPENVIRAVIQQESNGDPNAVSPTGCLGLMQLDPRYHSGDLRDPATNIDAGTAELAHLYGKYHDWATAFAYYNAGEGANIDAPVAGQNITGRQYAQQVLAKAGM